MTWEVTLLMSVRRSILGPALTGGFALAFAPVAGAVHPAAVKFTARASCGNHAPYPAATQCRWRSGNFRATFVFESHTGPHPTKACFTNSGPAPFGGTHGCVSFGRVSYKRYALNLPAQVRASYATRLSWLVSENGHYRQVASSTLKIIG
jgi:hypothetical protein